MSAPGWYPDPGGQAGAYRYWNGRSWGNELTSVGPAVQGTAPPGGRPPAPPVKRSGRGWLIGLVALAVGIVVVVVLAVRGLSGGLGDLPGMPGGNPSADVCPQPEAGSAPPQPNDGRVHSGKLSYPMLPAPWGPPRPEYEVPFGRDVLQQFVQTEQAPGLNWGAAVMVGELVAGDGFFAPKDGAEIVMRCVTGTFYGNAAVTRNDTRSAAMRVDGHDAWMMESDLSFTIPDIEATNELLRVVIVDLKNGSAGLFASSVPGNSPQHNTPAQQAMEGLRVR